MFERFGRSWRFWKLRFRAVARRDESMIERLTGWPWWLWRLWFRAATRRDLQAVCDLGILPGMTDYHDYPDSEDGYPIHFHVHTCRRCGKQFRI